MYTLVVYPNNTYTVKIDNEKSQSGSLEEDWDFLAPKTIPDPDAKKPEDWDDRAKIDDPEDKKPEVHVCAVTVLCYLKLDYPNHRLSEIIKAFINFIVISTRL